MALPERAQDLLQLVVIGPPLALGTLPDLIFVRALPRPVDG